MQAPEPDTHELASRIDVPMMGPLTTAVFQRFLLDTSSLPVRHKVWSTEPQSVDLSACAMCSSEAEPERRWVLRLDRVLVRVHVRRDGRTWATLAARRPAELDQAEAHLMRLLPLVE